MQELYMQKPCASQRTYQKVSRNEKSDGPMKRWSDGGKEWILGHDNNSEMAFSHFQV